MFKMIGMTWFEALYCRLEATLEEFDSATGTESGRREVELVLAAITELRSGMAPALEDRDSEIAFFYTIWPRFYGKLFYYQLADAFDSDRSVEAAETLPALIRREDRRAVRFFREHREFWRFYKQGSALIAPQFTRAYSHACFQDPLSQVLDPEGATVASHRAAWGLAFEQYRQYLAKVVSISTTLSSHQFEWKETKSAAVELLKAQAEKQSIYINGRPATAAQLRADFEARYRIDLKDFDKLLYASDTRKAGATTYLVELKGAFEGRQKRLQK
jgi:hypothetical protein